MLFEKRENFRGYFGPEELRQAKEKVETSPETPEVQNRKRESRTVESRGVLSPAAFEREFATHVMERPATGSHTHQRRPSSTNCTAQPPLKPPRLYTISQVSSKSCHFSPRISPFRHFLFVFFLGDIDSFGYFCFRAAEDR